MAESASVPPARHDAAEATVPAVVPGTDSRGAEEPLERAEQELALQIDDSLDGFLDIDRLLDQVLVFADLPVDEHVDFEYEEEDAVAYRIQGTPEGTSAHFLVGLRPLERDGQEFRQFQLEIQLDADAEPGFHRDALRDGPRVHLALDYDEAGKPAHFALLTERRVALRQSRRSGIDAYQGRYTSGAGYRIDFTGTQAPQSETFGIIDGHYANADAFQGIRPLRGDLEVDRSKIDALLARFQDHFERVRRRSR